MKIGLAAVECKNGNIDFNLKQILLYLQKAASRKKDYLFFGESFLQGFDSLVWNFGEDKEKAVSKKSAVIELIKNEAYILDIGVGFGYFELYKESIYSSYLVISNKGN
jgi:predicted amidohydrolase